MSFTRINILGNDESVGVREVDMQISDGEFIQHSTFLATIQFKPDLESTRVARIMQMSPVISQRVTYGDLQPQMFSDSDELQYLVKTSPVLGTIKSADRRTSAGSAHLMYEVFDNVTQGLCGDVSSFELDQFTVTVTNGKQLMTEDITVRVNISLLHVNSEAFATETVAGPTVMAGTSSVLNSDMITAAGRFARYHDVCRSQIRKGFFVTQFSKSCPIEGLHSKFVLWWDDMINSNYSVSCTSPVETRPVREQLVMNAVLQQSGRVWILDKLEYIIPITIVPARSTNITCRVNLWQGYDIVHVDMALVHCLGFSNNTKALVHVVQPPIYGTIYVRKQSQLSFSLVDVSSGHVEYIQTELSKFDTFELARQSSRHKRASVLVHVRPNIASTRVLQVVSGSSDPIPLNIDLLDASPLVQLTSRPAVYHVTRPPIFGTLGRQGPRYKRAVHESVSQFTHQDVVNEIILYYPPDIATDVTEDNFTYTLTSSGVQPADGLFSVIFDQSERLSTLSVSEIVNTEESPILTIVMVITCVFICGVTIIVTVLCLRAVQRRKKKHLAKQALVNSEPRLILSRENGSYKLLVAGGDEFLSTEYSQTSPSRQIDRERDFEVSPTVPQVRVTPLIDKDGTVYDLHDYVNCEDMTYCSPLPSSIEYCFPSSHDSEESSASGRLSVETTRVHISSSIDQLPPIKKPNYSC